MMLILVVLLCIEVLIFLSFRVCGLRFVGKFVDIVVIGIFFFFSVFIVVFMKW